jgi:ABC-type antimicrobial peptide transport system permease subunit
VVEPSTYGFTAAVVLAAAVISGIIVRNKVYALDLVGVLKTRE